MIAGAIQKLTVSEMSSKTPPKVMLYLFCFWFGKGVVSPSFLATAPSNLSKNAAPRRIK